MLLDQAEVKKSELEAGFEKQKELLKQSYEEERQACEQKHSEELLELHNAMNALRDEKKQLEGFFEKEKLQINQQFAEEKAEIEQACITFIQNIQYHSIDEINQMMVALEVGV